MGYLVLPTYIPTYLVKIYQGAKYPKCPGSREICWAIYFTIEILFYLIDPRSLVGRNFNENAKVLHLRK